MKRLAEEAPEFWLVSPFLTAFLLFNILTATAYPVPWVDECVIAEPAVSFLRGHGFVIRFSEILGMYTFLLVPWLKVFGSSLRSLRSADILCMTVAFFVLWSAVKRLELVTKASLRLMMLSLLATEYAMIFAYRSGRYDGLGALLMALVFWLMSFQDKKMRVLTLSAACLFVPWAGLQYLPLLFTAGLALFLLFRWRYWMEIAASLLASAVGGGIFLALVSASGRLPAYLKFVHSQPSGPTIFANWIKHGVFQNANYIPKDFSLPFLFAAAVLLFFSLLGQRQISRRSPLSYAVLFTVLLTILMLLVAKFPTYYCYMVVIPLAIGVCSGLSLCKAGFLKTATLFLCALSILAGVGLNAAAWAGDRQDRNYARVSGSLTTTVHADDTAYVDPEGYLAARPLARDVYLAKVAEGDILSQLSQQQKDSITVLVIRPEEAERVLQAFGGNWQETGHRLAPTGHSIFGSRDLGFLTFKPIDLVVFRRR